MSLCPAILAETTAAAPLLEDPVVLVGLGVAVAGLIFFLMVRRGGRGAEAAKPRGAGRDEEAWGQFAGLLDELERVSEAMSSRFEAQAARMEGLISEAEARARSLESSMAKSQAGDLVGRIMAGGPGERHDSGLSALARHHEIYELADAGESAPQIAQKLRRPEGEVELILALRGTGGIS